jgi:hypothetical protein
MDLVHDFGAYKGTTTRLLYQVQRDVLRYSTLFVPDVVADSKVQAATLSWNENESSRE